MERVLVTFVVSVVIDEQEERCAGIDTEKKLTAMLAEMENIAAKQYDVFDTNIEKEDY